jgi:hypothetical protein
MGICANTIDQAARERGGERGCQKSIEHKRFRRSCRLRPSSASFPVSKPGPALADVRAADSEVFFDGRSLLVCHRIETETVLLSCCGQQRRTSVCFSVCDRVRRPGKLVVVEQDWLLEVRPGGRNDWTSRACRAAFARACVQVEKSACEQPMVVAVLCATIAGCVTCADATWKTPSLIRRSTRKRGSPRSVLVVVRA